MALKRKRSPNWHPSEKELLLAIVEENLEVLENKKTDTASLRDKNEAWEKCAVVYNSRTVMGQRSSLCLKSEWATLKKAARKELAILKLEAIKTGGGPPTIYREDPIKAKILSLLGLQNAFDCGAEVGQPIAAIDVQGESSHVVQAVDEIADQNQLILVELEANSQTNNSDRTTYTPRILCTPLSALSADVSALNADVSSLNADVSVLNADVEVESVGKVSEIEEVKEEEEARRRRRSKSFPSRRRPTLPQSSLDKLNAKKIEAIELQIKHAMEEREDDKRKLQLEMEESREKHQLETEILREKLKQEKIKTRILLNEKRKK